MNWLIFILMSFFVFGQTVLAETIPPKIPDPFCSPTDFFNYLNQKNHDRVLYVVQKCTNIDLKEKGPKGETFAAGLALTNWDDIFDLVIDRADVDFQPVTSVLIANKKYDWLFKLIEKKDLKFGKTDTVQIYKTFPGSNTFLLKLIELKKIDVNESMEGYRRSMLLSSLNESRIDQVEFLRSIPAVDQSGLFPLVCTIQSQNTNNPAITVVREYFKILLKSGQFDVNSKCENATPLVWNIFNNYSDKEVVDLVLTNPALNLSKAGDSYKMAEILVEKFSTYKDKYFSVVFNNPTFNFDDKSALGYNFWHFMVGLPGDVVNANILNYFSKLSLESINDLNTAKVTPLILFVNTRAYNAKDPVLLKFIANPKLDYNKMGTDYTPVLAALVRYDLTFINFLISKGADAVNIGDVPKYNDKILSAMVYNEAIYERFYKHPQLNINGNQGFLFKTFMGTMDAAKIKKYVYTLFNDPRFDKAQIDLMGPKKGGRCSAVASFMYSKIDDRKMLMELISLSTDETLNSICTLDNQWSPTNPLGLASQRGDLELVDYLYSVRKLSMTTGKYTTAFNHAWTNKQWPVVEYFINKGYKAEFQNPDYVWMILEEKKADLLKLVINDPAFDPEMKLRYNDLAGRLAELGYRELFTQVINNPKYVITNKLANQISWDFSDKTDTFYFDSLLPKFTIKDAATKLEAILIIAKLAEQKWPVSYFDKIAKLKNFDINVIVPKDNDYNRAYSYTLFSVLMEKMNPDYLDYILKMKAMNPNTVADYTPVTALLLGSGYDEADIALKKKYFTAYYSLPTTKITLPLINGVEFYAAVEKMDVGGSWDNRKPLRQRTLLIVLSSEKFKLTKDDLTKIYAYRKDFFYNLSLAKDFLNTFFSNPAAKPLAQWSSIISELKLDRSEYAEVSANFIIKFGKELDLNYKENENSYSLLEISINEENKALFDYLISNPAVKVNRAFAKTLNSYNGKLDYYRDQLLLKRGKDIPQTEFLSAFISATGNSNYESKAPEAKDIEAMKKILPYIKSFDKISELSSYIYPAPMAWFSKWIESDELMKSVFNRILNEDTTLAKNTTGVVVEFFRTSRFDILDKYIKLGYDITTTVSTYEQGNKSHSSTYAAVKLKSLPALKYLTSKSVNADSRCSGWSCDPSKDPFGLALEMKWFEGADYLVDVMKYNPGRTYNNTYSMLAAVKSNDLEIVNYLMTKKVQFNGTGSLVQALMDQNDEVLEIILNDEKTNPNDPGMDDVMKRKTLPIIEAARYNRIDYVKALLMFPKIDKAGKDGLGYRAIDWAATNGFQDIVELLKK